MLRDEYVKTLTTAKFYPLFNLFLIWLDEKDYEDPEDYKKKILRLFPEAVKAKVRPFGFFVPCDECTVFVFVEKKGSRFVVEWRNSGHARIADVEFRDTSRRGRIADVPNNKPTFED